jgi:hypothetical protein
VTKEEEPAGSCDDKAPVCARAGDIQGTGHVRDLLPANVRIGLPGRTCGNDEAAPDKRSNRCWESPHDA